ncbi:MULTISPECIES: hypothetical protein [unclassified Streptococcus]|uniref:hypothetical protein n=1 Tax=unclassified Streptococcus TaxID=2608887 RepID=UPI00359DAD0E
MSEHFLNPEDWDKLLEAPLAERPKKRLRDYRVPLSHQFLLMLWSTVVSLMSFVPLYISTSADGLQSQIFYMAWGITQGQLPYVSIFSRSGLLYSALVAATTFLGGLQWMMLIQLGCLYLSGIYLFKLVSYWTGDNRQALGLSGMFYAVNAVVGFGGFLSVQLAIPFVLIGLWLLVTYLNDWRRDEIFITYGLVSALALALEPRTLVFWLLSFVVFTGSNIAKKRWARGFYQQLAMVFGIILIIYPLAYIAVNLDLLTPYFEQAFIGNFSSLSDTGTMSFLPMGVNAILALGLGLLTGLLFLPKVFRHMSEQTASVVLLALLTLSYLIVAVLGQSWSFTDLLLLLPFGLLLTGLGLADEKTTLVNSRSARRQKLASSSVGLLKSHAYLPAVLLLVGLVWRLSPILTEQAVQAEREQIAQYLSSEVTGETSIYAWDKSATIYLDSHLTSASQIPIITAYPMTQTTQQQVVDELLRGQASFVIVNKSLPLPEQLQEKLDKDYQHLSSPQFTHFNFYQKQ